MRLKILIALLAVVLVFSPFRAWALAAASTHLVAASSQTWTIASGSQTGLTITGDMTFSVWFKADSYDSSVNHVFIAKYDGGGHNGYEFFRNNTTDGFGILLASGASQSNKTKNQTFTNGVWYHAVISYVSSTRVATFYINGSSLGTATLTLDATGAATGFYVGSNIGLGDYVDGYMDDLRIWSRALSGAEVSSLYTTPCTFNNGASLQGWWKFDNDATDSSGNSNTLTAVNSPTFSADTAFTCAAATSFNFSQFFPN